MTEDYCYELTRRYSEFLKLYERVASCPTTTKSDKPLLNRPQYLFPTKKLTSTFLKFLSITSIEKIAEERKPCLCCTHPLIYNF